ncbi:MAG: RING finger domain-containing protein [Promethearchaeia archaeon]
MVKKRDFDKILVDLIRTNPHFMNLAIIDAEGMPLSFAIKSRKYKIKPAILGSKTKALYYIFREFSQNINISEPLIQVFFFKKVAVVLINLKVINLFILIDIKGWPPNGKLLYQKMQKIKNLLIKIEESKDKEFKSLFETEKKEKYKISDISDKFLRVVAKNLNSLGKVELQSYKAKKANLALESGNIDSYGSHISKKLSNLKINEATCFLKDSEREVVSINNTGEGFQHGILSSIRHAKSELDTFEFGDLVFVIDIFEKSEIVFVNRFGKVSGEELYSGILLENRGRNLSKTVNKIYEIGQDIYKTKKDPYLKSLIMTIEFIGLPAKGLSIQAKKYLVKGNTEAAEIALEKAAIQHKNAGEFLHAGDLYLQLSDLSRDNDNLHKAEILANKALEFYSKKQEFEKMGDTYQKIARLNLDSDDIATVIENYQLAAKHYEKGNLEKKAERVNKQIHDLTSRVQEEIKNYINSSTGASIPFSLFEKKYNISEDILISCFRKLFERQEITGQVNIDKKRYTKKKYGTKEAIVGDTAASEETYELPKLNKNRVLQTKKKLENEMSKLESTFEEINFPFDKYLSYEEDINKLNFLEQKLKIYEKKPSSEGCIICFKQFKKGSKICDCGNGHYFHLDCMKFWLTNQKKCPICDVNILDNLKVYYLDTLDEKDNLVSLNQIVDRLRTKIRNLEEKLEKKEEQIYLMKDYSKKDKEIFEKLMAERDNKHLLEKELKKSSKLIDELKSFLEVMK